MPETGVRNESHVSRSAQVRMHARTAQDSHEADNILKQAVKLQASIE
jgi:hypothetical protein